ncbi:MAG TPA: hypothetical protein VGU20_05110 [Stellaceae bacterium]|nr:hypothetical protein [Stellaceae bacterium]
MTSRRPAVRPVTIPNSRYFMPLLALIAARGADSPAVGSHRLGERRFE